MPDPQLTAAHVAIAIVASAGAYGDDPALALRGTRQQRRAVAPAVVALAAWSGRPVSAVARMLGACLSHVYCLRSEAAPAFERARAAAMDALGEGGARAHRPLGLQPELDGLAEAASEASENRPLVRADRRRKPGLGDKRRAERTVKLRPITPQRLRFARMFLRARWGVGETAHLFDLDPDELAEATR